MSGLVNKVKEALHSDKSSTSQPEGTHGHHESRVANAADPRIDSDRDHRAAGTGYTGTTGTHTGTHGTSGLEGTHTSGAHTSGLTGTGHTGSSGLTGTSGTHTAGGLDSRNTYGTDGPATKTDGPHKSNVLNKADPRVDSDRDYSRNMGANPQGTSGTGRLNASTEAGTGNYGSTGTSGLTGTSGTTGRTGAYGTEGTYGSEGAREGTFGPHSSRVANAADPRVDSDRDGSHNTRSSGLTGTTGTHSTGLHGTSHHGTSEGVRHAPGLEGTSATGTRGLTGTTGTSGLTGTSGAPEGTYGPHGSRTANAADPRVDSDRDHRGNIGSTHHESLRGTGASGTTGAYGATPQSVGAAPNTAGPHKSDMMNKMDPRVDSDLDGSKTVGGNKTYQSDRDNLASRDPTDATQVPPSVLQKHVPGPIPLEEQSHHGHGHSSHKKHDL